MSLVRTIVSILSGVVLFPIAASGAAWVRAADPER